MISALSCLRAAQRAGDAWQRPINAFVDEFRRAPEPTRRAMMADPIVDQGPLEGLVAAVVSALAREVGMAPAPWVGAIGSPVPFFALPAQSFAMRLRLMIEAPPAFRIRNVFVPENYLSRA